VRDWDPGRYLEFADERGRPFLDLMGRVAAVEPRTVADLGCGPGNLTRLLARRWPTADVLGMDASPAMIQRARGLEDARLRFQVGDLRRWQPDAPVDVVVSTATLQWVPDHRDLLPRLVAALPSEGWLAFSVPGNFGEPSHQLLREYAALDRYAPYTRGVEWPDAFDGATYLADLATLGCDVDAWETTYLHVLPGPDPVFRWISATGARPVLAALPDGLRERFEDEYKTALNRAYPPQHHGTVLPFRRVFVVARRRGEAA
jgi:trans-aconitate 2-methyltransferase